jgi:S-adenosylmethionine/arginine decarboxylase-like enzyme
MKTTNRYWGYHLILDCSGCDHDSITSAKNIETFTKTLVKDIDMVAYGEPQIVHFGDGDKEGFTLIQLIETSNIAGHFVNENDSMYLDVFSCKQYDPQVVVDLVYKFFKPESIRPTYLTRQA